MKYLRRINESLLEDVEDILIELSDDGNKVSVNDEKLTLSNTHIMIIRIIFKKPTFINDNLVQDLIRLKLYLNENGYKDHLFQYFSSRSSHSKKFYIYNDSRTLRNQDIHGWESWRMITDMKLVFICGEEYFHINYKPAL